MIPTFDHNQSPTANVFRVLPQIVPPKNAEFRRLTLQKMIIFLVYFSLPAWQREEGPCSTPDLQAAFSPLLASVTDACLFSLHIKLYVVHGHLRRKQLWTDCISPCDLLKNYDKWLEHTFCDDIVLWPEEKRHGHRFYSSAMKTLMSTAINIGLKLTPLRSCCCEKRGNLSSNVNGVQVW